MSTKPPAPDRLLKYLRERMPKQSTEDLRAVQEWVDDHGERIEAVEETSSGTVVIRKNTCGSEGCKCQDGEFHGPYKYVVTRNGDSLNWEYKGPVSDSRAAETTRLQRLIGFLE